MVRVANPYKLEAYRHESFDEDEVWYLRASKSDDDDEQIEALARTYVVKDLNTEELAEATSKGKNPRAVIGKFVESEVRMSTTRATLVHMTHHWTLRYPADYTEPEKNEAGEIVTNTDGTPNLVPSPLATQILPLTPESIGLLEGISEDAYWHMSEVWAADGRTEKQEAEFPGERLVVDSQSGPAGKKKVSGKAKGA